MSTSTALAVSGVGPAEAVVVAIWQHPQPQCSNSQRFFNPDEVYGVDEGSNFRPKRNRSSCLSLEVLELLTRLQYTEYSCNKLRCVTPRVPLKEGVVQLLVDKYHFFKLLFESHLTFTQELLTLLRCFLVVQLFCAILTESTIMTT